MATSASPSGAGSDLTEADLAGLGLLPLGELRRVAERMGIDVRPGHDRADLVLAIRKRHRAPPVLSPRGRYANARQETDEAWWERRRRKADVGLFDTTSRMNKIRHRLDTRMRAAKKG